MSRIRRLLERVGRIVWPDDPDAVARKVTTGVALATVLAALVIAVQLVPEWQVRRAGVGPTVASSQPKTTPADVASLENELRKTVIQVVGGAFALLALYFTWRRVRVAEQGHITDRYTKAIEQLGAVTDEKPNIEVRLGAIYALERIARDSPRDHWTIMEVLTAYVRQNASAPAVEPTEEENKAAIAKGPSTEIQAILTVLGRRRRDRRREGEDQHLDLSHSDLRGAKLEGAHMEQTEFIGTHLEGAVFVEPHLQRAVFRWAHMKEAQLLDAHAEEADFRWAYLQGASFISARLERADLSVAHAEGAYFAGAHLEEARFRGAHLEGTLFSGAYLDAADFRNARDLAAIQFIEAIGWEGAKFDGRFSQEVGAAKAHWFVPAIQSSTPTRPDGE